MTIRTPLPFTVDMGSSESIPITHTVGYMPDVYFCGQQFYVEPILGLPLFDKRLPQVTKRFSAFVIELNRLGGLALIQPEVMKTRVFVSGNDTPIFMGAVQRLTRFTSWKIEFVSTSNPSGGLDARIIVPQ